MQRSRSQSNAIRFRRSGMNKNRDTQTRSFWGWGVEEAPDEAEVYRSVACEGGLDEACAGF